MSIEEELASAERRIEDAAAELLAYFERSEEGPIDIAHQNELLANLKRANDELNSMIRRNQSTIQLE